MPNLTKEDFIFLIQKKLEKQLDKRCSLDIEKDILKVFICGYPYMDINMNPLYSGYCFDVFPLDRIVNFVFKAINGYKIPDSIFNSLIVIHKPPISEKEEKNHKKNLPDSLSEVDDINRDFEDFDGYTGDSEKENNKNKSVNYSFTIQEFLEKVSFILENENSKLFKENCLYRKINDMYIIYTLKSDDGKHTYLIEKNSLKALNLTEEEIYKAALNNFQEEHSTVSVNEINHPKHYFEVSCSSEHNGASAFLFPELLSAIADDLNSDLYIVPICKKYFYVHKKSEAHIKAIYAGLKNAMRVITDELKLSENVFYYNRETDSLTEINVDGILGKSYKLN